MSDDGNGPEPPSDDSEKPLRGCLDRSFLRRSGVRGGGLCHDGS